MPQRWDHLITLRMKTQLNNSEQEWEEMKFDDDLNNTLKEREKMTILFKRADECGGINLCNHLDIFHCSKYVSKIHDSYYELFFFLHVQMLQNSIKKKRGINF